MDRDELLRAIEGRLSQGAMDSVRADLARADDAGIELRWLEDILAAGNYLPLAEVPPVLTQDLKDLFGDGPLFESFDAVVVFDSRTDRELAGVRGGRVGDGWSQTFTSPAADVALDVWPTEVGYEIEGHVMTHRGEALAYRAALDGPVSAQANTDALGRFQLSGLSQGRYQLTVANSRLSLSMQMQLGDSSQS